MVLAMAIRSRATASEPSRKAASRFSKASLAARTARPSDTGLARTEHMASRLWAITSRPVEAVTAGGTV